MQIQNGESSIMRAKGMVATTTMCGLGNGIGEIVASDSSEV